MADWEPVKQRIAVLSKCFEIADRKKGLTKITNIKIYLTCYESGQRLQYSILHKLLMRR